MRVGNGPEPAYDVTPDGERLLMSVVEDASRTADPEQALDRLIVVENWFEELIERVPVN